MHFHSVFTHALARLRRYAPDGQTGIRVKVRDFFAQWGFQYDPGTFAYKKVRRSVNPHNPSHDYDPPGLKLSS